MKKLVFAVSLLLTGIAFAQEKAPLFWGFANYGVYSGYQLHGALVNNEPVAEGYAEGNMNLSVSDLNLGYLGVGLWSNSDLTPRRDSTLGGMFNEWDFNLHWGKTFWFNDTRTWGLNYRTAFVWFYYPGMNYKYIHPAIATTFDWDHTFELTNPYVIPYVKWIHEYLQCEGNLLKFGLKKPIPLTESFSLCPIVEFVARDERYNWCFPTRYGRLETCAGMATAKVELDANYKITQNIGLFAKVAYCSIIDPHLRNNCDDYLSSPEYGENKDYCWGGLGLSVNF